MRKLQILTLLMLTATLSFSQETYPKKVVIDNDTLITVTVDQVRTINSTFDRNRRLIEELEFVDQKMSDQILNLEVQRSINKTIISKNNELYIQIDDLNKVNKINESIIEYKSKQVKHYKSKNVKIAIGGFTVGLATGTILFLILN